MNELFQQEQSSLEEIAGQRERLNEQRKNLLSMKSVAAKMRFQVVREDREALKDQSNQEMLDYIEYQKEMYNLNQQYKEVVGQIEKEVEHEILDIQIEDKKRSRLAKEEEIVQAQNVRTDDEYQFDESYKKHVKNITKKKEEHRITNNMKNQQEQREKELLDFMNDHCDQQVERQFKRSREINYQITETMREQEQAKKELELMMQFMQKPKKV